MIVSKREITFCSVGVVPGISALVESLKSRSTPFLPASANLTKSVFSPISVQSNLKSPVITILTLNKKKIKLHIKKKKKKKKKPYIFFIIIFFFLTFSR